MSVLSNTATPETEKRDPKDAMSRLKELVEIIKNRPDIKKRISLILNPDNPQSSTKLTNDQVNFIALAHYLGKAKESIFYPLHEFAVEFEKSSLSLNGFGIESAIALEQAINEQKLLKTLKTDERTRT